MHFRQSSHHHHTYLMILLPIFVLIAMIFTPMIKYKVGFAESFNVLKVRIQQRYLHGKEQSIPSVKDTQQEKMIDQQLTDQQFVGSALIVHNNKIVFEKSYGSADQNRDIPNSPNTTFQINSIQKSFTAVLVAQAESQGKLKYSDKLSKYYPNIPYANSISIRQLLDMTSGLDLKGTNGPNGPATDQEIVAYDLQNAIFDKKLNGKWHYSDVNFTVLTGVLAQVTGKSYEKLFIQTFITPFHLQQTTFSYNASLTTLRATGYINPDGSLVPNYQEIVTPSADWVGHNDLGTGQIFMSARDLFTLQSAILKGKVISKPNLEKLHETGSKSKFGGGTYMKQTAAPSKDVFFNNRGWGAGFEGVTDISESGENAVILLGNYPRSTLKLRPIAINLYEATMK